MELKLLNEPLAVKSTKLETPPKAARHLVADRGLLVAWSGLSYVFDPKRGERYHLAFYHPDYGWHACQWDKEYGAPLVAYPASETAIWVNTERSMLIYISVENEVKAITLASAESTEEKLFLLYSASEDLWIRPGWSNKVMQLRLQENGLKIVNEKSFSGYVRLMYPLADGAWILYESDRGWVVRSSSLDEVMFYVNNNKLFCCLPYLMYRDGEYYRYTEDPRRGWNKIPIKIERWDDSICFFAKQDNGYYAAVHRRLTTKTMFYRFTGESAADARCMWETPKRFYEEQITLYNGLVCVAASNSIMVSGREDVPENHGFLVWDPRTNAFYKDIPQFPFMHARNAISRSLQIPAIWADKDNERHTQAVR